MSTRNPLLKRAGFLLYPEYLPLVHSCNSYPENPAIFATMVKDTVLINSKELLRHINNVSGVVPTRPIVPIVANIHWVLQGNLLMLTATDYEFTISTSLQVENASNIVMNIALPPKLIQDTLKALGEQDIIFSFNPDSLVVTIRSDFGEYEIAGINGIDFPVFPKAEDRFGITLPSKTMQRIIEKTLFAASTDELKQNMNGVYFDLMPTGSNFVSTDSHRLVKCAMENITIETATHFLIPLKALRLLASILSNSDTIAMEYNERNTFFTIGNVLLVSRLVDLPFPPYDQVIPNESESKAIINKNAIVEALKRSVIFANNSNNSAQLSFSGNSLKIESEDIDFGKKAKESLHCLYDGADLVIGFDAKLLLDCLMKCDANEVIMEFGTEKRAVVILPDFQIENEVITTMLMPIVLSGNYYA